LAYVFDFDRPGVGSKSFNITNSCSYTVWPAISSGESSRSAAPDTTGFELPTGQWEIVAVPSGWSGRLWGRTHCSTHTGTGKFTCLTGDCGSGRPDCAGSNASPLATLAQFTMDGSGGMDLYDVSLVDGFNLPMVVALPQGAVPGGNCVPAGCAVDLNGVCPAELRAMSGTGGAVACKSACQAFGSPHYCCTGEYGNPDTCKPSAYSEVFKKACPRAVSYAYDGAGFIFTCGGGDTGTYTITFCPASATSR
jgi:hypothetical protein